MNRKNLSIKRNMKIGTFHLGSTMADVLATGVWNRVMKDMGYAATPIGLLAALRYFMVPLAIWSGERSDRASWRGYRRLPFVWAGRLMMIVGYLLLAFATVELLDIGKVSYGSVWWLGIIVGFLVSSVGYAISGSTFLALVYDRAPAHQRGRAVGVVWTFLLAGYPIAGILFARLLPDYEKTLFLELFVIASFAMLAIWAFALWGEETPYAADTPSSQDRSPSLSHMRDEIQAVWSNRSVRLLTYFIILSFMAGFMQDALLEPFGGKVFDMSVGETTRFQSYWGTMAILSSVGTLWAYRRFEQIGYQRFSRWGVILLLLTFILLTISAVTANEPMLRPTLLLLGIGYGLWNIGTLGLMVANSREEQAGLDLGIWTVITTLSRGGAIFIGGILFDLFEFGLGDAALAYSMVFAVEAGLLLASLLILNQMEGAIRIPPTEQELILSMGVD